MMRKILLLGLLFSLGNLQAEENALPKESSQEISLKNIVIEEPVVLDESVTEELVKRTLEIEESIAEELDADKLVEQLVEMVNEYNKSSHPGVPAHSPGTVIGPDCDLTPIANLLGTIASSIGRVTDGTSLRSTVLGILGDPNSVLGTDYTVVQALKEIIDFLDTENVITEADTPYVISTPGKYTVIENISKDFLGVDAIRIQSDDVTLNLNGYTITNLGSLVASGVYIVGGRRNIIVENGSLIGFSAGLSTYTSIGDITLSSLTCKDNNIGMHLSFVGDNILIENCVSDFNLSAGCSISYFSNLIIKNSSFNNTIGTGTSYEMTGLSLYRGKGAIVRDSVANENLHNVDGRTVSGMQSKESADVTFINCEANNNGNINNLNRGIGFYIIESNSFTNSSENIVFKDCIANNNNGYNYDFNPNYGGYGFWCLGHNLKQLMNVLMENCIANNNTQHGVYITEANKGHIENCQFINNGQFGVSIDSTVSDLYFLNNKFINNGSLAGGTPPANINNAGTRGVFLSNTAFMNLGGGSNYVDTGASSGLSTSAWSLAGVAPIPTWPIDNLNIIP